MRKLEHAVCRANVFRRKTAFSFNRQNLECEQVYWLEHRRLRVAERLAAVRPRLVARHY